MSLVAFHKESMRTPEQILAYLKDFKDRDNYPFWLAIAGVTEEEAEEIKRQPEEFKNEFRAILGIPLKATPTESP